MRKLLSAVITLFVCSAILNAQDGTCGQLYSNALPLLQRLNSEVVKHQNTDKSSPEYGAIICPGENLYHTRAAEAVWPLSYEYSITGNKKRLEQALILADWLFRQQSPDGSWKETPEEWTGTSTDQLLMLLLSYPIVEKSLSKQRRQVWLSGMEAAADYLTEKMSNKFASINYCATTTATLSEAYLRFGKDEYRQKAFDLARMVVSKMNSDWFIEGEGTHEGQYKYGVDLGYDLEMSLWGLARYAFLMKDDVVWNAVSKATANHFYFIYPDGMLDASSGIRSNKWTIFGSGTSDGCHPLFALMSGENPSYITAAVRNIHKIGECFSQCGLLGHGPDHDGVMSTPPCIYPTFVKAKSMAMAMSWVQADTRELAPLPCDSDMCRYFPVMGMAVVRKGPFCSTFTTYNYVSPAGPKCKYMHRPTGGALSALWLEGYGLLEASSQTEYHRWEPMSFPDLKGIKPLTPRIEMTDPTGFYTNLYEYSASSLVEETSGSARLEAAGHLKNRSYERCGIFYKIAYEFTGGSVVKNYEIRHQTNSGLVRIVEPLVFDKSTSIKQLSPQSILLERVGKKVEISLEGEGFSFVMDDPEGYRQVYPSMRAIPVAVEVPANSSDRIEHLKITFTVK